MNAKLKSKNLKPEARAVPPRWRREVERVLITDQQIARRVKALAREIEKDFRGRDLVVISLLSGTVMFLADLIRQRTQAEWCERLEAGNAWFAPVLSFDEAVEHPHNRWRETFINIDGVVQPAPAPRYSNTPCAMPTGPVPPGADQYLVSADVAGSCGT